MNSFFDLSESKKKGLSIPNLHEYAERFEIKITKISDKTGKNIKKTKNDLIEELNDIKITNKIKELKCNAKSTSKKKDINYDTKYNPIVLLWLPNEKSKFNNSDIGIEYRNNMFDKIYLEKTYNIKIVFGSILYYGDYYIVNDKSELIHLEILKNEELEDEINNKVNFKTNEKIDDGKDYIIIPREITYFLKNPIKFFKKLITQHFYIGSIELHQSDNYVMEHIDLEKDDKLNGIYFNYTISTPDLDYKLEVELSYLSKNGILNKDYPTYKFFIKEDTSLIKIIDFHKKLSNNQFSYVFKKYGYPGVDNDPIWTENVLIKDIKKNVGNEDKNEDSVYECIIYSTTYEKYLNVENINKQFKTELYINDKNISIMIQEREFMAFINSNDFTIYMK